MTQNKLCIKMLITLYKQIYLQILKFLNFFFSILLLKMGVLPFQSLLIFLEHWLHFLHLSFKRCAGVTSPGISQCRAFRGTGNNGRLIDVHGTLQRSASCCTGRHARGCRRRTNSRLCTGQSQNMGELEIVAAVSGALLLSTTVFSAF